MGSGFEPSHSVVFIEVISIQKHKHLRHMALDENLLTVLSLEM